MIFRKVKAKKLFLIINDMASATKKPKLDSNGAAHEEISGVYNKEACASWRRS